MGDNSIKILKPHVHLHIIGRKSTKFQMNPMKKVGGVVEKRSWLAKFKSAWAITSSKIVKSKFLNYKHIFHRKKVYKILSESDERCRSCGDKISWMDRWMDGWME